MTLSSAASLPFPLRSASRSTLKPIQDITVNQINILLRFPNHLMPHLRIDLDRLILAPGSPMKLLHARRITNNVPSPVHDQKRDLHFLEPLLQLIADSDKLVGRGGAGSRHRPPGASQRELPLPRLLERDVGDGAASGDDAPGGDEVSDDEEQVLQRPRGLELVADPAHGAVEDEPVPDASLAEGDVESDRAA